LEEKYRQGKVTLEVLNEFKKYMAEIAKIMGGVPEQEPPTNKKRLKFQRSEHGSITSMDDGWRNWRQATIQDVGAIILFHDSCGELDEFVLPSLLQVLNYFSNQVDDDQMTK
jgi:hypothetical protein